MELIYLPLPEEFVLSVEEINNSLTEEQPKVVLPDE